MVVKRIVCNTIICIALTLYLSAYICNELFGVLCFAPPYPSPMSKNRYQQAAQLKVSSFLRKTKDFLHDRCRLTLPTANDPNQLNGLQKPNSLIAK